jgi:hypothetical protein
MDLITQGGIPRAKIGLRLMYTILFVVILSVMNFIIQLIALMQFVILLLTKNYSEPLRSFSNKAAAYVYRLIRYVTLNDNSKPFPFVDFPDEMERPDGFAKFE